MAGTSGGLKRASCHDSVPVGADFCGHTASTLVTEVQHCKIDVFVGNNSGAVSEPPLFDSIEVRGQAPILPPGTGLTYLFQKEYLIIFFS